MEQFDSIRDGIEASIEAADHLTRKDAGAIEAIRALASTLDAMANADTLDADGKPRPIDNVSMPTFLRFCDALGLTPAGREKLTPAKAKPAGALSSIRGGRATG